MFYLLLSKGDGSLGILVGCQDVVDLLACFKNGLTEGSLCFLLFCLGLFYFGSQPSIGKDGLCERS